MVDMVGVTDLIMIDLIMMDLVTVDTSSPAVTVDFMAVDSVMVAADMPSPIRDTANRTIAADPAGIELHAQSCDVKSHA